MDKEALLSYLREVYGYEHDIELVGIAIDETNKNRKALPERGAKAYSRGESLISLFFILLLKLYIPLSVLFVVGMIIPATKDLLTQALTALEESDLGQRVLDPAFNFIEQTFGQGFVGGLLQILLFFLVIAIPVALILAILIKIGRTPGAMKAKSQDRREDARYRMNTEYVQRYNEALGQEVRRLEELRQRLKAQLDQLYAKDILKPRYRGLIPVATIYGYLDDGICDGLEGHDGAYAEYMKDVRTNRIVESVEKMQQAVSAQIGSLNASLRSMGQEMDRMRTSIRDYGAQMARQQEESNRLAGEANRIADREARAGESIARDYRRLVDAHLHYLN